MHEINHILLDMDGVIADFLSATLKLFDFPIDRYPANEWDIEKVLGISVSDMWGTIDRNPSFWRDLKPYPWKDALIGFLNDLEIPWSICTSPARNPQCAAQKVEWMREHISPNFTDYQIGKAKYLLANPRHLLIDDSNANCATFIAHGGEAVLFPQRWNDLHHVADGFAFVTRAVADLIADVDGLCPGAGLSPAGVEQCQDVAAADAVQRMTEGAD